MASAVLTWTVLSGSPLASSESRVRGFEVTVALDQKTTATPVTTLRAVSVQPGSTTEATAGPLTLEWRFEAPWQGHLELNPDLNWRLTLTADGYWASPVSVERESGQNQIRMRLIPTGRLVGQYVLHGLPGAEPLPAAINIRLESVPVPRVPGQQYSHRLTRFLVNTVGDALIGPSASNRHSLSPLDASTACSLPYSSPK